MRRPRRSLPLSRASERIAGVAPRATRQRGKMTDTLRRIGGRNHEPHTSESARAIIQRLKRVFNERDVAGVAAVYTEDIEYDDDAWPEPVKGHAGVERLFGALWRMESDCRFELVDGPYLSEDGGRVAVRWRVVGTMTGPWDVPESPALAPTGGAFAGEIGGFYELEGDRIRRGRVIANQLEMGIQFGAMPPPGSRAQRLGAAMQRLNARRMRRRAKA
ncbi:MAG: nuclear transport factor 2 family protein [Solirubrobacterales bacterium]